MSDVPLFESLFPFLLTLRCEGEGFKFYMYDLNVVIFEACSQLLNSM